MDLTKRQQEIVDFIKRYSARHGYPPTVRDIGQAVGLASSSTVHQHLANLERVGTAASATRPSRGRSSCSTAPCRRCATSCGRARCRCVGSVAAGQPMLAEENIEDYVAVPPAAGGDDGAYLLRVRGESMKKVGIIEGDLVVVRPQETADERRHRRRARRRGGDRQALLPRAPTTCACSRRTTRWSRSAAARCGCSAASSA